MTDAQIELERLANLADCHSYDIGEYEWYLSGGLERNALMSEPDAKFISACTPTTILSLLADIRRLENEVIKLRFKDLCEQNPSAKMGQG